MSQSESIHLLSPFDYGSNIDGNDPWRSNNPSRNLVDGYEDCVFISNGDYKWIDSDCDTRRRFLCNHCDGVLNKYVVSRESYSAIQYCPNLAYIPRNPSSFHNQRDFEELRSLCKAINANSDPGSPCWTGLSTSIANDWNAAYYTDLSQFDYGNDISGGVYPWGYQQPSNENTNEFTTALWPFDDYLLHDFGNYMTGGAYTTCNMPSALCFVPSSTYTTLSIIGDCEYHGHSTMEHQQLTFSHQQWYNGNGLLDMHLTFKIADFNAQIYPPSPYTTSQYHAVGILLQVCQGKHYWFLLQNNTWGLSLGIGFYHGDQSAASTGLIDHFLPGNMIIDPNTFYTLQVTIHRINDDLMVFNVSFDNFQYIALHHIPEDIADDYSFKINEDGYSGSIIINSIHTDVQFRSLYVSGTPIIASAPEECTQTPTTDPTSSPLLPTMHPSIAPTSILTAVSESEVSVSDPAQFGLNLTIIFKEILSINITDEIIISVIDFAKTLQDDQVTSCNRTYGSNTNIRNNETVINIIIFTCNQEDETILVSRYKNDNLLEDIISTEIESEILIHVLHESHVQKSENIGPVDGEENMIGVILAIIGCIFVCVVVLIAIYIKYRKNSLKEKDKPDPANVGVVMTKVHSISSEIGQDEGDAEELYDSACLESPTKGETTGKDEPNLSEQHVQGSVNGNGVVDDEKNALELMTSIGDV